MARQEGGLTLKEMNDKLFIGRIESESWRQIKIATISHLSRISIYIQCSNEKKEKEKKKNNSEEEGFIVGGIYSVGED